MKRKDEIELRRAMRAALIARRKYSDHAYLAARARWRLEDAMKVVSASGEGLMSDYLALVRASMFASQEAQDRAAKDLDRVLGGLASLIGVRA